MKTILVLGVLGLVALFRRPDRRTGWTAEGLPQPIASKAELRTQARALAASLRARTTETAGLIRQFQRGAGLIRPPELDPHANDPNMLVGPTRTAEGIYGALTRQALGWYGQLWQEETP